MSATFHDT